MFVTTYQAATVTASRIFFTAEETVMVSNLISSPLAYLEPVIGYFKMRHPNRMKVLSGTKFQSLKERNMDRKPHRNHHEHEHRSKRN